MLRPDHRSLRSHELNRYLAVREPKIDLKRVTVVWPTGPQGAQSMRSCHRRNLWGAVVKVHFNLLSDPDHLRQQFPVCTQILLFRLVALSGMPKPTDHPRGQRRAGPHDCKCSKHHVTKQNCHPKAGSERNTSSNQRMCGCRGASHRLDHGGHNPQIRAFGSVPWLTDYSHI